MRCHALERERKNIINLIAELIVNSENNSIANKNKWEWIKKKKIGRLEFDVDYYVNRKSDVACPKRKLKLHLLIYNIIDYRV